MCNANSVHEQAAMIMAQRFLSDQVGTLFSEWAISSIGITIAETIITSIRLDKHVFWPKNCLYLQFTKQFLELYRCIHKMAEDGGAIAQSINIAIETHQDYDEGQFAQAISFRDM